MYFKAAQKRACREHDQMAWVMWQGAALVAYAPAKPSEFPKLEKFKSSAPPDKAEPPDWKTKLSAVRGWVGRFKKG